MFNELGAVLRQTGQKLINEDIGKIDKKEGIHNYVTSADLHIQEELKEALADVDKDAVFVGEEQEHTEVAEGRNYFLVDPIDGTTNFIHDMGLSCLAAAYCKDRNVIAAAVYNPYTDELFTAEKGKGAYLNGRAIRVSERPISNGLVALGAGGGPREESIKHVLPIYEYCFLNSRGIRSIGSAELAICYIAAGRIDAYTEYHLMPWDYAAGGLILKEAGGEITDLSGAPLPLDRPSGIAAGNLLAYADIMRLIKEK